MPDPASSSPATIDAVSKKLRLPPWAILLLVTALLYLPGTQAIPLMDRDEPRFAHATMEMMQRGEWFIPYFNGEYRFDKPPLTYWWMRLHYNLLGFHELAARLHSIVASWLVALVVFRMAGRIWGQGAGWWASMGWLTSLQVLVHGRLCVADMPMVLSVTLMMSALMELLLAENAPARRFNAAWWTLWLAAGAGFLAKGPVALLVPALAVALWRLVLWRKPAPWARLQVGPGFLLALVMVAAWGIPALLQTKGLFWQVGMGEHVVKRGTQAFNGRVVLPFYYFGTAFLSLLPWIAFLPVVWRQVRQNWTATTSLVCAWFAAPYLVFLLYATQLPHYVMPGFPGFFLLLGMALGARTAGSSLSLGRFGWGYLSLMVLVGLVAAAIAWLSPLVPSPEFRIVITSGAVLLVALCGLAIAAARQRLALALASLLVAGTALVFFGHALRAAHPIIKLRATLASAPRDKDLVAWGFTEPSLVYYTDRKWIMLSKLERVRERLARGKAGGLVLLRREWTLRDRIKQLQNGSTPVESQDHRSAVDELTSGLTGARVVDVTGYNLARSSWVELRVILP